VAFLADIGVKWYARLESGDDIHTSESTLMGIAVALQLSASELEYMLELAGLRQPLQSRAEATSTVPEPVHALLRMLPGISATISDRILTPLRWNHLAEGIYGHSRFKSPVERNALVRSLFDSQFIKLLGTHREEVVFRSVGMFRLNYSSPNPSPFVPAVFERVKDHPLFQQAWKQRLVADDLDTEDFVVRNHTVVGRLTVYAMSFSTATRPDLFLRTLTPADEDTGRKFGLLENLAKKTPLWPDSPAIVHLRGGP